MAETTQDPMRNCFKIILIWNQ